LVAFALGFVGCVGDSTIETDGGVDASSDVTSNPDIGNPDVGGCEAGAMSCNGTCTDVTANTGNCGRCSHDCGMGAMCMGGVCQPVLVTSMAASAVSPSPT
jgi:hypothetical protein